MKILVGSRQRLQFSLKKIFDKKIVLFVEPQFYDEYKKENPDLEIVKLEKNDAGFGYFSNALIDYTLKNKEKYYLFSDDDIYGLKKRITREKSETVKPEEIDIFLKEGEAIIKNFDLAQLSVSFIGHNWYYEKPIKMITQGWGLVFIDAEKLKKAGGYDENLKMFNDRELTARLLLNGYKTATWNEYMFVHKMATQKGGLEVFYRNGELVKEHCIYLMKKYPDYCKIIKNDKHKMFEPNYSWNKLYLEGQRRLSAKL